MAAKLSDCLTKAKGIGILTDAEMAYVMKRAAELGNEQQAVKEIHAQRMKEYEAIKAPDAADQVVVQTTNETVAMAAYAEEVRNATKSGIQPEAQALEAGRQAGEAAITGAGTTPTFPGPKTVPVKSSGLGSREYFLDLSNDELIRIMPEGTGYLYHAAREESLPSVQAEGLKPGKERPGEITGVYLAESGLDVLILLPTKGRKADILFRIRRDAVKPIKTDMYMEGSDYAEWVSKEAVPPEAIEVLGKDDNWYPLVQSKVAAVATQPNAEADIESVRSFLVSPQQQGHTVRPSTEQQQETALQLGTKLIQLHGIGNVKMQDTFGMYQGSHNRQFVTSFDARHNANLTALVQAMAKEAGRTGQDSIRISRVLEPNEDSDNARPGISVEFKHPIPVERIDDIVRFLRARGIDGFDLVPDGYDVATGNPRTFKALRFEEIPEFSQQPRARKHQVLLELQEELMKMEDVANVSHQLYDTVVLTSQDYDKNGILKGAAGGVRAAAWADRAFHASDPQAARKRDEARAAGAQAEIPAPHLGSAEEVASKELETAAALIAAGSKAAPTALIAYQGIYRRVVALMQENRAILEGKKWSAATPESVKSEALLRALGELDAMLKFVPDEVRGKVGGFFQLAKVGVGEAALAKFFGDRVRTLERVLEQFLKKQYLAEINDLLDKSKAKTTNGIKKSARMDADAQAFVDSARLYSKLDADQVATQTVALDATIATATDDDIRIIANRDLATLSLFGDLTHRNANQLYSAYTRLKEVVETGKDAWKQQAELIKARNNERAAQIIAALGVPDTPGIITAQQRSEGFAGIVKSFAVEHLSLIQFLDYLIPGLPFTEELKTAARQTEGARTDFLLKATQRLHDTVQGAIGSKSFGSFGFAAQRLGKQATIDFNGKPMKVSKLQAIQHLLTWDQADAKEKMKKADYTEEVIEQFRKLTADPESQAVLEFLRKEYADSYNLINPIYRANYGTDLPKVDFYAPTRYDTVGSAPEIAPFGGMVNASGTTAGFMHQRVSHNVRPRQESAITVYLQHMNDVAHFIYDAQLLREMRGALLRNDVKDAVTQKFGGRIWQDVTKWLDTVAKSSNNKASSLATMDYIVDSVITMKAIASLSLNPKSIAMQADSALRVIIERPMKEIARAIMNLPKLADAIGTAFNSPAVQRRLQMGASADVRYVMEKSEFLPTAFMRLARLGMLPLNWGDALLTSVSAGISYRASFIEAKKMGMLDAAANDYALDRMDASVYRYSQPASTFNRSLVETTGNAWFRAFMLFMSDPRLKTAIVMEKVRDIAQGKNVGAAVRGIIAIEVFAIIAQTIANAYRDWFTEADEEDLWTWEGYARAMAAAPFAGLIGIGTVVEGGLSWLLENKFLKSNRDPFGETTERISQLPKHVEHFFDPEDPLDFLKALNELARTSTLLTSIFAPPVAPIPATVAAMTNLLRPLAGAVKNAENSD